MEMVFSNLLTQQKPGYKGKGNFDSGAGKQRKNQVLGFIVGEGREGSLLWRRSCSVICSGGHLPSHENLDLSLEVTTSGCRFRVLEPLPCAPEGGAHPLSPLRAQAPGALMLTAHLQPILPGAAERSEREPGALCQDLQTQVSTLSLHTDRNEETGSGAAGGVGGAREGLVSLDLVPLTSFLP